MIEVSSGQKGFTIVEVLIAAVIMALVITGAITIYMMSITAWREGSTQIALQRDASLAMEKMVRGLNGRNGIREADAQTVVLTDSDGDGKNERIDFTDLSGSGRNFRLEGTEIKYDISPDPLTTKVTDLAFSRPDPYRPKWLRIELTMGEKVRGKWIYVNLRTDVKIRN